MEYLPLHFSHGWLCGPRVRAKCHLPRECSPDHPLRITPSLRFSNSLVSGALMLLPYGNWSLPSLLGHCPLAKLKRLPILFMQQKALTLARCPGDRQEAGRHHLCPDGVHSPEETINAHVDMKSHPALSSPRMGDPSQEEGGNRTRNWHRVSCIRNENCNVLKRLYINSLKNNNKNNQINRENEF